MKSSVCEKRRKLHQMSMALVTVQRSPSVTGSPPQCGSEGEAEDDDGTKSEKSECFFACKDTALGLTLNDVPTKKSERRPSTDSVKSTNSTQSNNSDIQQHLQSMIDLLNPEETLKMAVKLESQRPNRTRYLVIVSRSCYRSTTTERKSKITRHNSTKTRNVTAATNIATMRQLSTDSIQRTPQQQQQNQQQQHQLSQTESSSGGEESADAQEKHISSASVSTTQSSSQRQNLKSDSDKISASGDSKACEDGVEESCLLGIDCNERTTIGLVLPILADTTIHLDGDGGFSVSVYGKTHIFKPVSVQAMWSALQTLHKVSQKARENNFYPRGPSHDWTTFYDSHIESEQSCLNEWNAMDSLESRRPPSPDAIRNKPTAKEETESVIKMKLKEIMMSVDLDEVTSKYIRGRLEELLDMDLGEFKSFIDAEMLTILGQMDAPTEIFDHVYLGSEWNASNLEELQKNGIRHILNVTREIDNFFPGVFDYFNVRVYDDEKTNLLKYWDNTFRYITRAKSEGSKVLVHCKMGVSRSASVVIAYAMKAYNWEFKHALQHVKQRRSCIKPNKNFLNQLETYRGMLDAMKNKEKLQRSKSETNLKSTKDARLLPGSEPTPLIQALNQSKSKSGSGRNDISCGDNIINICNDGTDVNIKRLSRSKASMAGGNGNSGSDGGGGGISGIGIIAGDGANDNKHRRLVRRSSSTSPQAVPLVPPHMTVVIKQQSQSLENLTPERSVAEEPKNMRFPGSNGENYSVTQNQVRHIQKNVQPPPPPPPPPPAKSTQQQRQHQQQQHRHQQRQVYQQQNKQRQQIASVRTRVLDLETTHTTTRKTADDRRSLNLQFGRSVSHDTSTSAQRGDSMMGGGNNGGDGGTLQNEHSPVWTSSAKLITQTSNLKCAGESITADNRTTCISDEALSSQRQSASSDISGSIPLDISTTTITSDRCKEEHEGQQQQEVTMDARRHSRKTHSWTATATNMNMQSGTNEFRSGGIVLDRLNVLGIGGGGARASSSSVTSGKFGSNSSIDSISSSAAASTTPPTTTINVHEEREQRAAAVITRTHRQRDLPSRHASWGSGDTRSVLPVRNSSWAAYDSNRNSCHYGGGGGAILEGQIHELNTNKSNKTVTPPQLYRNMPGVSPIQSQHQHHVGTVKRTKQKLEQCGGGSSSHVFKKICPENGDELTASTIPDEASTLTTTNSAKRSVGKGATNLFRSASAAGSTRVRCSPYRCNSVEIVPAGAAAASAICCGSSNSNNTTDTADILTCHMVMRRSEGSRPLHNELFNASSSAPESYTISDIENKNTLPTPQAVTTRISSTTPPPPSLVAGLDADEEGEEDQVVLRGGSSTNITAEQRVSGSVQILKKNFEAKAGSSCGVSSTNTNVLQIQNVGVPTTKKKGHHSLPSSPVAQHVDPQHHHHHQQQQQQEQHHHHHTDNNPNSQRNSTASNSTVNSKTATFAVCDVDELAAEIISDTNTLTHVGSAAAAAADTESTNESLTQTTIIPASISSRQISSSSSFASASSSSSSSSSSSTSSASSGRSEPYIDRNVKVLVNKYQTTPTPASATISGGCNAMSSTAATTSITSTPPTTVVPATTASPIKPRRHSYYDSGGQVSGRTTYSGSSGGVGAVSIGSSSKVGKHVGVSSGRLSHEYNDSRPPPAPVKSTLATHTSADQAREAVVDNTQQPQQQQQHQQQHQQRRLQQHGRTHPLSRLTLPKQSFNTAAYNTM